MKTSLLFVVLLSWTALAAAQDAPAPADAVNLVFLGDKKPVLIRFNIELDGKSVQANWNDYLEKWFRHVDRNHDGALDEDELKLSPNGQAMRALQLQGAYLPGRGAELSLAQLDKKPGDKVTLAEFQAYYRKHAAPVQVIPLKNNGSFAEVGTALFKALDLNKDGKLSKEELLAAVKTLRKLDLDDDEWITPQELVPNFAANNFQQQVPGNGNDIRYHAQINDAFLEIRPGDTLLGQVLLERYDQGKVQRLTQKQLTLNKKTFARLDKDGNGGLDREELNRWHDRRADIEFTVRLGKNEGVALETSRSEFRPAVKGTGAGNFQVSLSDSQINVGSHAQTQRVMRIQFVQSFLQQFRNADTQKKGFVELTDLAGPQFQNLRQLFKFADRDGDGKLTLKEVQDHVDLQSAAANCYVSLTLADQGRAFFQLLDTNRDGRLSQRELLNAWSRVEALDKDKKGYIVAADFTRQFQINVKKGQGSGLGGFVILGGPMAAPVPAPRYPEGTPEWFRRMDRNGDGDVSLAEFLGTREEFDRIDTNRDGLISAEEATHFDVLSRSNKK